MDATEPHPNLPPTTSPNGERDPEPADDGEVSLDQGMGVEAGGHDGRGDEKLHDRDLGDEQPGPEFVVARENPSPKPSLWHSPRARLAAAAATLVIGCIWVVASWWSASPPPPTDLLGPQETESNDETLDVEQMAFRQRQEKQSAEPTTAQSATQNLDPADSGVDAEWIERLAGRWKLDLGHRAISVVFAPTPVKVLDVGALRLALYPVAGLGLPPYFTVLKRSEGESFLAFQNEKGEYQGLLDDLQVHGEDLFSYRIGGTSHRGYGHRAGRIGRQPDDPLLIADPDTLPGLGEDRPVLPEPIEITVQRQSVDELWRRAEALKDAGRYDSLEIALDRVLGSYPDQRKAQRWRRSLSKWRAKQTRQLRSQLNSHLEDLEEAVEDQDLGDVLDLWLSGSRPASQGFFETFFNRFEETRLRYQLKSSEVDDGTLIFEVTLTFEGSDGKQRSLESRPWRARLVDEYFLDPFPG